MEKNKDKVIATHLQPSVLGDFQIEFYLGLDIWVWALACCSPHHQLYFFPQLDNIISWHNFVILVGFVQIGQLQFETPPLPHAHSILTLTHPHLFALPIYNPLYLFALEKKRKKVKSK